MLVFAKCSVVIAIVQSRDHDRGHFLAIATAIKIEKKARPGSGPQAENCAIRFAISAFFN
jgi:hypothetical protein